MTENQYFAKDYLERYSEAATHVSYLAERCMVLRSKIENATAGVSGVECWTGEWQGICRQSGKEIVTRDSTRLLNPKKVYAPSPRKSVSYSSTGQEALVDALILREEDYKRALRDLEHMAIEMAKTIDQYCVSPGSAVLKYCYLLRMNYQQVADSLGYSYAHIRKLHWDSLEELGGKLIQNNTK